jgi:hypothetical protein
MPALVWPTYVCKKTPFLFQKKNSGGNLRGRSNRKLDMDVEQGNLDDKSARSVFVGNIPYEVHLELKAYLHDTLHT